MAALLIVDGMNVIGSRPTGWWRDRDGAVINLAARLRRYAALTGEPLTVVFDGRLPPELAGAASEGFAVQGAPGRGRGAADDAIVELVANDPEPAAITVVTSDRELRRRVLALGAAVSGPSDLLRRLEERLGPEA